MSVDEIIAELLKRRGIADAEKFFNPQFSDLAMPEALPGVVDAADVILAAIAAKKPTIVFGDYDCDGICATAILVRAIEALGGQVTPFIPRRLDEGYGMTSAAVERMLRGYPEVRLVITVDNGINSVEAINTLNYRGIAVVVTDHHLPGVELPRNVPIVDPKAHLAGEPDTPEELQNICGAAVAFLLARRLVDEAKNRGMYTGPNIGGPLLVLAGIATVTDVMPLTGQNRVLVSEALKYFHQWAPMGLKELHARAARSASTRMTSKDFSFMLGPRINASGRLAGGLESLELMLSDDREIAREAARIVDNYNSERKAIEQRMADEAMAQVVVGAPAQVIDLPDGHPGVSGIVAARVLEKLDVPVPVCVLAGNHGSARSPEGINIRDAFTACSDYLTRYGGHAAAGGFSVKPGRVDDFRAALCDYCLKHPIAQKGRIKTDDAEFFVDAADVTLELAEKVAEMEPFGEGNPEPILGVRGAFIKELRTIGQDGRHLTFALESGMRCVWWNHGDELERLKSAENGKIDIAFTPIVSEYGDRHVEMRVCKCVVQNA